MQAPRDDASTGALYPREPASTPQAARYTPHYQWLDHSDLDSTLDNTLERSSIYLGINSTQTPASADQGRRRWQMGTALTGTAVVSAGLALPFVGEQAITVPVGEAYIPQGQHAAAQPFTVSDRPSTQSAQRSQLASQTALDQGQGLSPQVAQSQGVAFSHRANRPDSAPLITQQADGSWTLAYPASSPSAPLSDSQAVGTSQAVSDSQTAAVPPAVTTQAIVTQLVQDAARSQSICSGSSCRSLSYIQAQLPQAQQTVAQLQQQISAFVAEHGQSDMAAYQAVLTDRINEISEQKARSTIELLETQRYVDQLQVRLSTIDVAADLGEHLLAIDTDYQNSWLQVKQIERQLLEEFSKASIDATQLHRLYSAYQHQEQDLYASAQSVLGNYLLSTGNQNPDGQSVGQSVIYRAPAALDLLQALIVATHQKDLQELRSRTIRTAEQRLQERHQAMAHNISEYEKLQDDLAAAQRLVSQYEAERDRIATTTASATLAVNAANGEQLEASPALATAQILAAQAPEGSVGKTILSIVIAAGAIAVAAQRRSGDISKALSLEIEPDTGRNRFGLKPQAVSQIADKIAGKVSGKRLANPVKVDLLTELLEVTGQSRPAIAAVGPALETHAVMVNVEQPNVTRSAAPTPERLLAAEVMGRELTQIVNPPTTESRLAEEIRERAIAPVTLPLAQIDAFADSAVRWVLKDLGSSVVTKPRKVADG